MLDISNIVSGGLFQLGYVYPKIESAQASMTALGGRPFTRFEDVPVHSQTLRGHPVACRQTLALGYLGPLNIELIEPIEGHDIYTEFLEAVPAGGLHDIAWKVDDIDAAIAAMRVAGHEEVQAGGFGMGSRFHYFDLREPLGHNVELLHFDAEAEALFAQMRGDVV